MRFIRTSPLTGVTRVRNYAVTSQQLQKWYDGELIQDAMPHLSPEAREFILSGISDDEWEQHFSEGN